MKYTAKQILAGVMAFALAADFFPTGGIPVAADAAQTPVPAVTDCTGIGWTMGDFDYTTCADLYGTGFGSVEETTAYTTETVPVTWYDGWQDVAQDAHFRYAAENSDNSRVVLREVLDDAVTVQVPRFCDYPDGGIGGVVSVEYDGTAVKAGEGTRQRELVLHDDIGWLTLYDFSADPDIADDPENYYDLFTTLTVCNPNCGFTIPQIDKIIALLHQHGLELTIRGIAGSTAEAFAKAHGLPFIDMQKTVGNLTFRLYSDHASVYRFTEEQPDSYEDDAESGLTEVTVPAEIEGLPVTEIEENAFYRTSTVVSVKLPETVTSICPFAFDECTNLREINLPDSLRSIGNLAFHMTRLETVTVPDSVTGIGIGAFNCCEALKAARIPAGLTSIPDDLFYGCRAMETVMMPERCTEIGESAFSGCVSLRDVKLPEGLESIGKDAFFGSGVSSVQIPDSCTEIGESAFYNCAGLKEIRLPKNLTELSDDLFGYCEQLETVLLPDGLKVIGCDVFGECPALRSVVIPDTVTAIGSFAFSYCENLTQIRLPGSLARLGGYVFKDCTALEKIVIPASVQQIEAYCFDECTALSEITILADDCEISSLLLGFQSRIEAVTICGNADSAAQRFAEDNHYVFRTLDGSMTIEPDYEKVLLMEVREDGAWVIGLRDEVPALNIPSEYQGHPVVGIADQAFLFRYRLAAVTLPETLKTIGKKAFFNSGIQAVILPEGLTTLGENAFGNCIKLESVTIPESITVIPQDAFYGCTIRTVQIPDSVTEIGDFAFGSSSLTEVHLPASVESIGYRAFAYCENLRTFTAENSSCQIKEIFGDPDYDDRAVMKNLTIYGAKDSVLHAYANWMDMPFCTPDGEPVTERAAAAYQPSDLYFQNKTGYEQAWGQDPVSGTEVYSYDDPDLTTTCMMYTTYTTAATYTTADTTTNTAAGTSAAQKQQRGDLDQNGRLSIADAVLLARLVSEDQTLKLSEGGRSCADIDGDGEITASDITTILLWLNRS